MVNWRCYLRKLMDVGYILYETSPIFVTWCWKRVYTNKSCTIVINSIISLQAVILQTGGGKNIVPQSNFRQLPEMGLTGRSRGETEDCRLHRNCWVIKVEKPLWFTLTYWRMEGTTLRALWICYDKIARDFIWQSNFIRLG